MVPLQVKVRGLQVQKLTLAREATLSRIKLSFVALLSVFK